MRTLFASLALFAAVLTGAVALTAATSPAAHAEGNGCGNNCK